MSQAFLTIGSKAYVVKGELGSGSFGKVYHAVCFQTKSDVAIKVQPQIEGSELQIIEKLKGKTFKNLANIFDYAYQNNQHYTVMEYCNSNLYQQIQKKTIDPRNVRYVMIQITLGIKELHDQGLVHRDLKPENILIQIKDSGNQQQEVYKICDFGTCKQTQQRLQTKYVGTPYYLAPEQLAGQQTYSKSVDIWALGAVVYELLTNKPLFDGKNMQEIELKIQSLNVSQQIDGLKNVDQKYKELLKQMLNRNPEQRVTIDHILNQLNARSSSLLKQKKDLIEKKETIPIQLKQKFQVGQHAFNSTPFQQQQWIAQQNKNNQQQNKNAMNMNMPIKPVKAFQINQNQQQQQEPINNQHQPFKVQAQDIAVQFNQNIRTNRFDAPPQNFQRLQQFKSLDIQRR